MNELFRVLRCLGASLCLTLAACGGGGDSGGDGDGDGAVIPPLVAGRPVHEWEVHLLRGDGLVPVLLDEDIQNEGPLNEFFDYGGLLPFPGSISLPGDGFASGEITASADGREWSLSTESVGTGFGSQRDRGSQVKFTQTQSFIKRSANASLSFTLTEAVLETLDVAVIVDRPCPSNHRMGLACDMIKAELFLQVEAFTVPVGAAPFDVFFRVAGGATLLGIQGSWDGSASAARFSKSPLWTVEDFDFSVDSVNGVPEAQVTMRLRQPRTFTVDLSAIAVGQAFTLQSFALVTAYNRADVTQTEGGSGSRALLRDPLSIGGTTITHGGLEPVSTTVSTAPPDAPVVPAQCTPGPGPDPAAGTIQFSAANYTQLESSRTPSITVTRAGGSVGAVTATISTSDGTAVAGRDYTPMNSSVFFADGDSTPRTFYLDVINDGDHSEADATVNLTLSQPGGCVALGAQSSTVLTITDDDAPPPPPTFNVGGTVTGLTGSGLILEDRANFFELRPTANGTFVFGSPLAASRAYDVRVKTQPNNPLQTCSVTNGTGAISNANITNIEVSCAAPVVNGALDPGFGDGGKTFTAFGGHETALALQADGKVVMVGGSVTDFTLARYTAAGRLDLAFGSAGTVTTDIATDSDQARGVAIQSDGKIVVVGSAVVGRTANNLSNFDFAVARYNADGTPDLSFSGDGKVTTDFNRLADVAHAVVIQSDGKIVVVGSAATSNLGGSLDFAIARYNPDGTLDLSFDADGKVTTTVGSGVDIARNVVLQPNQAILVSGFSEVNRRDGTGLVRYASSGALDSSFGSGGRTSVPEHRLEEGLSLQSDGKIVIAGSVDVGVFPARSSQFGVMRFDANGFPDNGFGSVGLVTLAFTAQNDFGRAIALQADGKIVVAGQSRNGANPDFAVARLNTDGTPDESFGSAGKLTVSFFDAFDGAEGVVIQPDGQIVLGGFATSGTQIGYGLARVNL